jgi:thiol-disulfide isomerase/thioredoxin
MPGELDHGRRRFLSSAAMTLAIARFGIDRLRAEVAPASGAEAAAEAGPAAANQAEPRQLAALGSAAEWLNSPRLSAAGLSGRVVLVQFGTYSCINWLRTLPYVRAWDQRYRKGLTIIGVHTPEFEFEKNLENVRRAVQQMKIDFPIAIDNDYSIWRAFNNRHWPALYFMDARGRVRHSHFGEGDYERSEVTIQQLLAETGAKGDDQRVVPIAATGFELAADWQNLRSPEIYLGYDRTENFSSPGGAALARRRVYAAPSRLQLNRWALAGEWTMANQPTVLSKAPGRIVCRFHARDVHLVMGPPRRENPVRYRVSMDGQPPGSARGVDADEGGSGTAVDQRMYQLIRQPGPIVDRTFEIEFLDAGVEAFAFTFG